MSILNMQNFNNVKQFFTDLFSVRFNFNIFSRFPKEYFSNEVEIYPTLFENELTDLNSPREKRFSEHQVDDDINKEKELSNNQDCNEVQKIIDLASILSPSSFDPYFLINNIETLFLIFTNPEFSLSAINNNSLGNLKTEIFLSSSKLA